MKIGVPLLIVKGFGEKIANAFPLPGRIVAGWFSGLDRDLELLGAETDGEKYATAALLSALMWAVLFGTLIFALSYAFEKSVADAVLPALGSLALTFIMFMCIFIAYPAILLRKDAEEIDSALIYALNDLVMQVTAGTSLVEGMKRIAAGRYGKVSHEFRKVIELMVSGESPEGALVRVAQRNKSEFMRRVLWQLATVMHTGASIDYALKDLVKSIREHQNNRIRKYSQNLNFHILIYLMLAVVLPSLTILLLTTISVFISKGGTLGIGRLVLTVEQVLVLAAALYIAGQVAVVEYIRVNRPSL